ncbi:hypothetical protein ULG90_25170 [Halopseudomonas pachastrellae]|nr:hypothetical protein ULG90_25170 [Halopseudomonas pachastrellae]
MPVEDAARRLSCDILSVLRRMENAKMDAYVDIKSAPPELSIHACYPRTDNILDTPNDYPRHFHSAPVQDKLRYRGVYREHNIQLVRSGYFKIYSLFLHGFLPTGELTESRFHSISQPQKDENGEYSLAEKNFRDILTHLGDNRAASIKMLGGRFITARGNPSDDNQYTEEGFKISATMLLLKHSDLEKLQPNNQRSSDTPAGRIRFLVEKGLEFFSPPPLRSEIKALNTEVQQWIGSTFPDLKDKEITNIRILMTPNNLLRESRQKKVFIESLTSPLPEEKTKALPLLAMALAKLEGAAIAPSQSTTEKDAIRRKFGEIPAKAFPSEKSDALLALLFSRCTVDIPD